MSQDPIQFCCQCGEPITITIPEGDNRKRHVCLSCGYIQYQNPKVVTGCIPVWEDKILLCKRAIEPRYGYWTLPAGFMENGETLAQGAERETWEEACAPLRDTTLYAVYSLPRISQVYVMFRANLLSPDDYGIGVESLDTGLFEEHEIPWDEIAFRVVEKTLKRYLEERVTGNFTVEVSDII